MRLVCFSWKLARLFQLEDQENDGWLSWWAGAGGEGFQCVAREPRVAGADQELVVRRSAQAGDDQLPAAAARKRRAVLRSDLWPDPRLAGLLREIQERPLQ